MGKTSEGLCGAWEWRLCNRLALESALAGHSPCSVIHEFHPDICTHRLFFTPPLGTKTEQQELSMGSPHIHVLIDPGANIM